MFTSTVVLAGTVVIEGIAFQWSVTTDRTQRLAVSHQLLGTRVEPLVGNPEHQARSLGRALLASGMTIPDVDAVDDFDGAMVSASQRKR